MIEELVRQQSNLQKQVDGLIKPEVSGLLVSAFQEWPAKVGLWHAGNVQRSTGNIFDETAQGRTLTYNGNPTFNQLSNGTPYCDYDGTGDYHIRADETDLDILGTEAIYAAAVQGLAMAGWFWTDSLAATASLAGKYNATGNQQAYLLQINITTGQLIGYISNTGAVSVTTTSSNGAAVSTWFFGVLNYDPSSFIDVWLGMNTGLVQTSGVAGIPASIFNSSAGFEISGHAAGGSQLLDGRMAICVLCANVVPSALISRTFERTRGLFGV